MTPCAKPAEPPFAAEGGLEAPARLGQDPYAALDDLMAVVEAVCPVGPPRGPIKEGSGFLM